MNTQGVERREFQRLRLDSPISGTFAGADVTIGEIGILGARIEHDAPLESQRGDLQFVFGRDGSTCGDPIPDNQDPQSDGGVGQP